MGLTKEEIRDRLVTKAVWCTPTRTALFATVPEDRFRYIVAIFISGNLATTQAIRFEKLKEDGTYEELISPIPVAPADFRQLPTSYSIEDPIISLEGGTRLYGQVDGLSLNTDIIYWDSEF